MSLLDLEKESATKAAWKRPITARMMGTADWLERGEVGKPDWVETSGVPQWNGHPLLVLLHQIVGSLVGTSGQRSHLTTYYVGMKLFVALSFSEDLAGVNDFLFPDGDDERDRRQRYQRLY